MANAKRDQNFVPTLIAVSSADGVTPVTVYADPTTHRILTDNVNISAHLQRDQFTSTNNQTQFTASTTVVADWQLVVNGVIQAPSFDYTVAGNIATLTTGIPAGLQVLWFYIK